MHEEYEFNPESENNFQQETQYELLPEIEISFQEIVNSYELDGGGVSQTAIPSSSSGQPAAQVRKQIASGNRDENQLTNLIFFARHPELGGQRLSTTMPNYTQLSQEWIQIRNTIIRPLLSSGGSVPGTSTSTSTSLTQPADQVRNQIASGNRDENQLTSLIFFARHPELGGQRLSTNMPNYTQLSQEWIQIRNTIIRPLLSSGGSVPGTSTSTSTSSTTNPALSNPNIPPVEGPRKGITGYTGRSGKKCWDKAKSADIIDNDAPWNKPSNRSAKNYANVLDYLNVGEPSPGNTIKKPSENPRYRQALKPSNKLSTYCNIYVHDATRMMWASIPHWIMKNGKWDELGANNTVLWLNQHANSIGWFKIDSMFTDWIVQQNTQRTRLPFQGPSLSNNLILAAQNISAGNFNNPSLLNQASFIAQQFANRGLPTVAVWRNTNGTGHVAMIRPESEGNIGAVTAGVFKPRSAQAGATNFSDKLLGFKASSIKSGAVQFFVHE